jgi:acyl-CoA thioesterase
VHFYDLSDVDGWLLGDAHAEHVADGIINSRVRVWSERGALVAQGLTQMISKPGEGAFVQAK